MPNPPQDQPLPVAHFSLYTQVHKGLRSRLYRISTTAGKLNYPDSGRVLTFRPEFDALAAGIRLHHRLEEKFIHPLVADRIPGGTLRLEEEHRAVDQMLNDLQGHFAGIITKGAGFARSRELGLELYLGYNRFIAFFLNHINWEEEETQNCLWNLTTEEELVSTFGRILSAQSPQESLENLTMILPSVNIDELTAIFKGAQASVPSEGFQRMCKLAEGIVEQGDWSTLKSRLALG